MGSELYDNSQRQLWGDFSLKNMLTAQGFYDLVLLPDEPMKQQKVIPRGLLEKSRITVWPFSWQRENYLPVITLLEAMGYCREKQAESGRADKTPSLFIFYYDWRKGIDGNAAELSRFIREKQQLLAAGKPEDHPVKFDLIGHSMGGLLACYYAAYGEQLLGQGSMPLPEVQWQNCRNIRKVIMIASPLAGYTDTLYEMIDGLSLETMAPRCPPAVLGTFISYYQMLPDPELHGGVVLSDGKKVDVFDPENWKIHRWGLLDGTPETTEVLNRILPGSTPEKQSQEAFRLLSCYLEQGKRFKAAVRRLMYNMPADMAFYTVASGGFDTAAELNVDPVNRSVEVIKYVPGDGKVALQSAWFELEVKSIPKLRKTLLDGAHMGVMRSKLFCSVLRNILQE